MTPASAVIAAVVGSSVNLTCSSFSDMEVQWRYRKTATDILDDIHEGNELDNRFQQRFTVVCLSTFSACSLIINNVSVQDAGMYVCRSVMDGSQHAAVQLSVFGISCSDCLRYSSVLSM